MHSIDSNTVLQDGLASASPEMQRFTMLESLGIDVWLPRKALSGIDGQHAVYGPQRKSANPGDTSKAHRTQPAQQEAASAKAANVLASVAAGSADKAPLQNKPLQSLNVQPKSQVAIARAPALEWLCLFYKDWLFVDDVSQANVVRSAYMDWMQALVFALGIDKDEIGEEMKQAQRADLPIRRIKWPPTQKLAQSLVTSKAHGAQSQSALSETAKLEYVEAWFERQRGILGRDIRHIVLMGKNASGIVKDRLSSAVDTSKTQSEFRIIPAAASDNLEEQVENRLSANLFGAPAILLTPSSLQMWNDPFKKKTFWQALERLRS